MPHIVLTIEIEAPIQRCFDLARSIDFHMKSMEHTDERAIVGRVSGLIELGEEVTWRARHLGLNQTLTSRVTYSNPPNSFVDEMVRGAFRSFRHEHLFESLSPNRTRMIDDFKFVSPLGPLGRIAEVLFLTGYMRRLLHLHQRHLKAALECEAWRQFVPDSDRRGDDTRAASV